VACRSIELGTRPEVSEIGETTLEILRVADHDAAILQNALRICWSFGHADPTDASAARAIRLLEQAITFLGVPPARRPGGSRAHR
jgi:hypothetical protein